MVMNEHVVRVVNLLLYLRMLLSNCVGSSISYYLLWILIRELVLVLLLLLLLGL